MHGPSEVAGQNCYSVLGLRECGIDAQSVVLKRHPFGYPYDVEIGIDKNNRMMMPIYVIKILRNLIRSLRRYDVFHFHYAHSLCENLELWVYDMLGKKYFYEFHGSELRDCTEGPLANTLSAKARKRNEYICKKAHGIILHDDELIPYLPNNHAPCFIVPLRVDVARFSPAYPPLNNEGPIRIVHAPSRRSTKGTNQILSVVQELSEINPKIELVLVEGKTQEEAFGIYGQADIIIDQILIGTYGVFAIECMAMGKPVICYVNDMMKARLPEDLPLVSADANSLFEVLKNLVENSQMRHDLGVRGRAYALAYHDYRHVARMLGDIYLGNIAPMSGRDAFEYAKKIGISAEGM